MPVLYCVQVCRAQCRCGLHSEEGGSDTSTYALFRQTPFVLYCDVWTNSFCGWAAGLPLVHSKCVVCDVWTIQFSVVLWMEAFGLPLVHSNVSYDVSIQFCFVDGGC